jgi:hypothetical protein
MDTPQTCGIGLAEHGALPSALSALLAAMADVLEHHTRALDPEEAAGAVEIAIYKHLASEHRDLAARLELNAHRMESHRDLPMARHDARALTDERARAGFARYVAAEEALAGLLAGWLEHDRAMLAEMSSTPPPSR